MACGSCGAKYPGAVSNPPVASQPTYVEGGRRYVILNTIPAPTPQQQVPQAPVIAPTPIQLPTQT